MKKLSLKPSSFPYSWKYTANQEGTTQGAQIDLLFDRDDHAITVCEIKYTEDPFIIDKKYAENLKIKIEVFQERTKTAKQIFLAMISANGLKKNIYSNIINEVVTMGDLFKKED